MRECHLLRKTVVSFFWLSVMTLPADAEPQEDNVSVSSRAEEIELERTHKARNLRPNEPSHAE